MNAFNSSCIAKFKVYVFSRCNLPKMKKFYYTCWAGVEAFRITVFTCQLSFALKSNVNSAKFVQYRRANFARSLPSALIEPHFWQLSMENRPGYKETVVCPYNKAHVILKSRFMTHLIKCEKNYPDSELIKCPFDTSHRVMPDELAVCSIPNVFAVH